MLFAEEPKLWSIFQMAESQSSQSSAEAKFIYPPETFYSCIGCGSCCRQRWVVEVDSECYDALPDDFKTHIVSAHDAKARAKDESLVEERFIKRHSDAEGCPLLDPDDGLCLIHKRIGYESKPFVCREFPFRFIETPSGVIVDVSFVCNEVLNQRGAEISTHRDEIARLYAKSKRKIEVGSKIILKSKTSISYEAYTLIEERLLEIFSDRNQPFEDRLVAGNIFLYSIVKNVYDAEKILLKKDAILKKLNKFQPRHFMRLYAIAKKSQKMISKHKQQLFVVTFITFASSASEKRGKLSVLLRTWANNVKQSLNIGSIRVPVLPGSVPLRALVDVEFNEQDQMIGELAERYIKHCIFRKTFVAQYGLFRGYNILLLLYGVIKWLSRVFALRAGRKTVSRDDFAKAVQLVERQYVRHSDYLSFLRLNSRAMGFVDKLFDDLGFAPIIVKS